MHECLITLVCIYVLIINHKHTMQHVQLFAFVAWGVISSMLGSMAIYPFGDFMGRFTSHGFQKAVDYIWTNRGLFVTSVVFCSTLAVLISPFKEINTLLVASLGMATFLGYLILPFLFWHNFTKFKITLVVTAIWGALAVLLSPFDGLEEMIAATTGVSPCNGMDEMFAVFTGAFSIVWIVLDDPDRAKTESLVLTLIGVTLAALLWPL